MQEAGKRLFPIRWVGDLSIMNQLYDKRAYNHLKRKYLPMLNNFKLGEGMVEQHGPKTIWVCWLQGEGNAPELVKKCISSIRKNAGDLEVCLITNDNINSYIDIPVYIRQKLEKKQMQYATFSDYIRMALLAKHGGIWIDATVLLTSPIPDEIISAPLFCFQKSCLSNSPMLLSSWFISATANQPIIQMTKYLFEQYWLRENHLCNYYLFHLLVSLVVDYNEANRQDWYKMPYFNNVNPHVLQFEIPNKFDPQKFQDICHNSFAHKLTYKLQNTPGKGTFYDHLFNS